MKMGWFLQQLSRASNFESETTKQWALESISSSWKKLVKPSVKPALQVKNRTSEIDFIEKVVS